MMSYSKLFGQLTVAAGLALTGTAEATSSRPYSTEAVEARATANVHEWIKKDPDFAAKVQAGCGNQNSAEFTACAKGQANTEALKFGLGVTAGVLLLGAAAAGGIAYTVRKTPAPDHGARFY